MIVSETLIRSVHPALNSDPQPEAAINLSPSITAWLTIDDQQLIIATDSAAPVVFNLANYTIQTIIAALPVGLGATIAASAWLPVKAFALAPVEIAILPGVAGKLSAYTSALWQLLRPINASLTTFADYQAELIRMMDVRQASGGWLDVWGLLWAVPRISGESDANYQQRMIATVTLPRSNNRALEELIKAALNITASVVDDTAGPFIWNDVTETWGGGALVGDFWGPANYGSFTVNISTPDDAYSLDQLIDFIDRMKAAGTLYTLVSQQADEAVLLFSDVNAEGS